MRADSETKGVPDTRQPQRRRSQTRKKFMNFGVGRNKRSHVIRHPANPMRSFIDQGDVPRPCWFFLRSAMP